MSVLSIISYDGSALDIWLNYLALVLTFAALLTTLHTSVPGLHRLFWIPLTIGLMTFQIVLCFELQCVGISIVWSAYVGYYLTLHSMSQPPDSDAEGFEGVRLAGSCTVTGVTAYAACLWVYYAVVEEPLTSVAHLCAVLLGVIIGYAHKSAVRVQGREQGRGQGQERGSLTRGVEYAAVQPSEQ